MASATTKIDIFSGFLGAGKTTLIKKLIPEGYRGEKIVLIENEFGEIGIDGGFLQDAGITVNEMNSGCICCSLVGDFGRALRQVATEYAPDRIVIEPSGVGKLSDVIGAVRRVAAQDSRLVLNSAVTVADAKKVKLYRKNFGEFYENQVAFAGTIVLSHTGGLTEDKLNESVAILREINASAPLITTPWEQLSGEAILAVIEQKDTLSEDLLALAEKTAAAHEAEHHHHHHDDNDDDDDDEHERHHHDDDDDDDDDDDEHEHHHHDHHADEIFDSYGTETAKVFTREKIATAIGALESARYGNILRAKGILRGEDGWIHFDYVPGEIDLRSGPAAPTGRLVVIGERLDKDAIAKLFDLE